MNGFRIIRELAQRRGSTWRPSPGAVYSALSLLEDEGLICPADDLGPKHFQLTDTDRAKVERLADAPAPGTTPPGRPPPDSAAPRSSGRCSVTRPWRSARSSGRAITQ